MSRAIFSGRQSQLVADGATPIQIVSVDIPDGVTFTSTTFQIDDTGDYQIETEFYLDAIRQVRSFIVDLYDNTAGVVVQKFRADAEAAGIGDFHSFIFALTVADASHEYSIRVSAVGGGSEPRMNIVMCRVLIAGFSSGGGTVGPGTINRIAKFTAVDAVGDSCAVDNGSYADFSVGLGRGNILDPNTTAFGQLNKVYGNRSVSVGTQNYMPGMASHGAFFGYYNRSTSDGSHMTGIGNNNRLQGVHSTAVGSQNRAYDQSTSIGYGNNSYASQDVAVGYKNVCSYNQSVAVGHTNTVFGFRATAFGHYNNCRGVRSTCVGRHNVVYSENSAALGYYNRISYSTSDYGSAVGCNNRIVGAGAKSSVVGYKNVIQQGTYSSAFGGGNYVYGEYANAFGMSNLVVSAFASAFGVQNEIGTNPSSKSTAVGYKNKIGATAGGSQKSSVFGYYNDVAGDYNSVSGYKNVIVAGANLNSAFGFNNRLTYASRCAAVGGQNILGNYIVNKSSALGYNNRIATAQGVYFGSAVGYVCTVNAPTGGNAIGYKAYSRVSKTTNICGPQIIRKHAGEDQGVSFESFCGVSGILATIEIDLTVSNDYQINLPAGAIWFWDELDIQCTVLNGTITSQAQIHAGNGSNNQKYLADVATTLLTATGTRERYTTLLADDSETQLVVGVAVPAVLNSATEYKARFYIRGMLIESQ